jgi:UDP-N-acetylglucosamine 1-carboxyvinyltransferase
MDIANASAGVVWLREMSPTVTENIIMLATGLKGKTTIIGAASEPQVQDLCNFLVSCGAEISGIGSSVVMVEGSTVLKPKNYEIFNDHYEIATFLALGAATGGEIKVHGAIPSLMPGILDTFTKFGINVLYEGETAIVPSGQRAVIERNGGSKTLVIKAQPWPALPVDLLPMFIPLALTAERGQVLFHNWMYEAGLFWTSELTKLGANIIMADPHRVIVTAGNKLIGAEIEAPFIIRAVVAMVMSAMIAEGESMILNADVLYRGHPYFAKNLQSIGASIEEIK